jgi:hypothetical protein
MVWWLNGVDFLYANIVLQCIGHMVVFVCMLESPENDFGNSVKTISVIYCVLYHMSMQPLLKMH